MKRVAGSLRLELAQYRELQVFSQFGSELDAATRERLNHGEKLMTTLKQNLHAPVPMEEQVIILLNAKERYLNDILSFDVPRYNTGLIALFKDKTPELLTGIRETGQLSAEAETKARELCEEYAKGFKPSSQNKQGE
jgi:F-type H+-transporting ATPase subunit alpha